jgi:type IV secretory pathway VirB10-like protein
MLSEAHTDNSGVPSPPPLGRLLVERGFLTEEQLQAGLAEQGSTGLPLGQLLIGMGFVTTATIAQALATQQGGMVKTEYGFSTGFAPEQAVSPPEPAVEIPLHTEAPQVEAPAQAWQAPPEVAIPPVATPVPVPVPVPVLEMQPAPVAEVQPPPAPVAEVRLPMPVETHEAAEADLAMAAARIEELQAELREQQRRTEESEARLAELAADAEAAREGLNSAVQRFGSMKQEIATARQAQLELREENERLVAAAAEPTPARELQVVRMEIASMRNELSTVMDALRAVHARLGEHAAVAPAPPAPAVPAPAGVEHQLVSS